MGAIGGLVGLDGGVSGTGFDAPKGAEIIPGVTEDQIKAAYGGNQNALQNQAALLAALQGQNGIGNQSQIYNQLQGVVNGTGPNPAQAMLAQATGANTANQAALMAGQRGASANIGLLARQAAQQGAMNQQNAIGQSASLQANQGLNALGQAGALAGNQVANQMGATTANTQAQQSEQSLLQNALAAQNGAQVQMQGNLNQGNTQLAQTGMQGQQKLIGGLLQGAGAAAGLAHGGEVKKFASGGFLGEWPGGGNAGISAPMSSMGQYMTGGGSSDDSLSQGAQRFAKGAGQAFSKNPSSSYFYGQDLQQPEFGSQFSAESYRPNLGVEGVSAPMASGPSLGLNTTFAKGGSVGSALKAGGRVAGQAAVSGDSTKNDTVKALLSPGEVVIPRSVMQSKNPAEGAAKFVAAVLAKKKAEQGKRK